MVALLVGLGFGTTKTYKTSCGAYQFALCNHGSITLAIGTLFAFNQLPKRNLRRWMRVSFQFHGWSYFVYANGRFQWKSGKNKTEERVRKATVNNQFDLSTKSMR